MPNENYPLPKLLRYFREKKQMTQAEVAEQLSISRSGYANYESGRILPGIEHIPNYRRFSTTTSCSPIPCH